MAVSAVVSFEYILFKGLNDTPYHVRELTKLLNGLRCRINLIRFHPVPGTPLHSPDDTVVEKFKEMLNEKGILPPSVPRADRISMEAACGLLSTKELVGKV